MRNPLLKSSKFKSEKINGPGCKASATIVDGMRKKVRTYSANDREIAMLDSLAKYHGFSKSGMITNLVKKEFWRVFPTGTGQVQKDADAWVKEEAREEDAPE